MKVCVIGAGPSGITALKNLIDLGLDVVCYDFNTEVGGNWIYNENVSHSSVFETTHIISSKTLSQYEDFTFDEFEAGLPDYPSHDQLRRYFQAYATKFNLYPHIQFNTLVQSCDLDKSAHWIIKTIQDGKETTETFSHLVVCNGHHWKPRLPNYPGNFTGKFMHSHEFKQAKPFEDQRILVIGGGNSACDVAVETSRVSRKTSISWRRGYRIVPKFLFGKPSDVVASRFAFLPTGLKFFLSELSVKIFSGSNNNYGLPEPEHAITGTHPTINEELLYKRAQLYYKFQDFEKAYIDISKAIEADAEVADFYILKAKILISLQDYEKALVALQAVENLFEDDFEIIFVFISSIYIIKM